MKNGMFEEGKFIFKRGLEDVYAFMDCVVLREVWLKDLRFFGI